MDVDHCSLCHMANLLLVIVYVDIYCTLTFSIQKWDIKVVVFYYPVFSLNFLVYFAVAPHTSCR